MTVQHTSRTDRTYYLHVKNTAVGKPRYFFSTAADGSLADQVPDGYEIYENVKGQVFLMMTTFRGHPLPDADKRRFASYMAMLRFTLIDKKTRTFAVERFCFRGSVDDWIPIAGPDTLAAQVRQYVKHLGRERGLSQCHSVQRLFKQGVPAEGTDPHPANLRARRAYEKAGFKLVAGPVRTRWGEAVLMERWR